MTSALLAACLVLAPRGSPPPPDAALIEEAMEHYAAERYTEAAAVLREAYDASGTPQYLFPLAQSERWAGQCGQAITHYRGYLDTDPPDADAAAAHEGIAVCEQILEERRRAAATPSPPAPEVGPEHVSEPVDVLPPPRPWYLDPAGDTLVAVGLVASGVGAGLLGAAAAARNGADGAGTEDDFAAIDRRQQNLTTGGVITLSVGATSLLAGVVRWAIVGRRNRRARR